MRRPTHPLGVWLAERSASWQARAWLAAAREPDLIAAEALRQLNRHAFATKGCWESQAGRIYDLKRHALRALFNAWPCRITTQEQTLMCVGCGGRGHRDFGPPWDRYSEPCFRCRGTGVHKVVQLYAFDFTIAGSSYRWHQPAEICGWAAAHVAGEGAPYVTPTWHAPDDRLSNPHVRVLLAVLRLWLTPQLQRMLIPDGPRWRDQSFGSALGDELRLWHTAMRNLPRWLRYRWLDSRLRNFRRGFSQDDLPF